MTEVLIQDASMIKVDKYYEEGLLDLAIKASKEIASNETKIDAIIVSNAYSEKTADQTLLATKLASSLGINALTFRIENGDASGGAAISTAYYMIKSGMIKTALVIGVEKLGDFPGHYVNEVISQNLDEKFSFREGLIPQSYAALRMKMYMKKYNVDYDYFVEWPYLMHKNGAENPYAFLKFQADKKTISTSQIISDPLRLFDSSPRADGAAAILMTSDDVKLRTDSKVKINSVSSAISSFNILELPAVREAFNKTKEFKPEILEIHDSYSINAALILEEIGLEKGKSLSMLDTIQVNLSGGLKARGYPGGATGIYQIAEEYMQLTEKFPGKRASAERGTVISTDELGTTSYIINLQRC
ncbi:thiolase family protein [Acidianus sulfidivorans JP7]|uniref:Acetyl-CoA synthetase n=1 Tax=Acidianus sulfidivorans JP7 TaxID=619593 RepID=A0A2U9INY6_9CREN|nr:thiolase family protein [Acidianus sulfidivorans]AWR97723.1 thiolase family protein [Acidianus sulfidivorans JP7]